MKYRKKTTPYVPADPTRERLAALYAAGATVRGVAAATGLTPSGVSGVNRPGQTRVQARTAELIANVTLRDVIAATSGRVPAIGTRRRIQALMAMGWRHEDLEAHSGVVTHMIIGAPRSKRSEWVMAETHGAVLATYDALWDKPGPSTRTRAHAAARGWQPPAAWDDDSLDDPTGAPAAVESTSLAHVGAHPDDLRDYAEWGKTLAQAAALLGIQRDSLVTRLRRIGDDELTARFARNDMAWEMAA